MPRGSLSPGQEVLINALVQRLALSYPGLKIDSWPDRVRGTNNEIDALAGPYAIEHTSIDSVDDQRANQAAFNEIVPTQQDFKVPSNHRYCLTLPWEEVGKVKDRAACKTALARFVNESLCVMENLGEDVKVPGISFPISIHRRPSKHPAVHFARALDIKYVTPEKLREQLLRKVEKLARYKAAGNTTLLLLESEDGALMNKGIMLELLHRTIGIPQYPENVDEVWYVDSSIPEELEITNFTNQLKRELG